MMLCNEQYILEVHFVRKNKWTGTKKTSARGERSRDKRENDNTLYDRMLPLMQEHSDWWKIKGKEKAFSLARGLVIRIQDPCLKL